MAECKQAMNQMVDASSGTSARHDVSLPIDQPDVFRPEPSQQDTGGPCLAPLLQTPETFPAEPEGRADLLHRALTSPWRLLAPRRAVHAGARGGTVERSCHAFGHAATAANTALTGREDISAPGRVDRRSAGSPITSHRSLFTIDGLPEGLAPDPPFLTLPQQPRTTGTDRSVSSGPRAPRPLQHAATTIGTTTTAEPYRPRQSASHHNRNPAPNPGQPQPQPQLRQERSGHRLASRAGGASEPSSHPYDTASGARYGPEPAGPVPQPYPPYRHAHSYSSNGPQQQQPLPGRAPPEQQPQPQPQPPRPAVSTASGITGFLGEMHHLLRSPGGADAFLRGHEGEEAGVTAASPGGPAGGGVTAVRAIASAGPLLPPGPDWSDSAGGAAAPAGACGAAGGAAAAAAPAPGHGQLDWDDARNPMSFHYNPSLQSKPQPRPQQPPARAGESQHSRTALQYSPHTSRGNVVNGGPAPPPPPEDAGAAAITGGRGAGDASLACERNAGGVADWPAGGGGGDVDVVSAEGPFVVLEMKGPRGTPNTHAAAAAAFVSGASASPAAPDAAAAAAGMQLTLRGRAASYFAKWRGVGDTLMPADQPVDVCWSWLGSFLSIAVVAVLNQYLTPHVSLPLMIASFGASAVLLFGVPASKLAQPRNFLGGQVLSAVVGVCVRLIFKGSPDLVWLSAALGMSTALAAMQVTRTVHPPGGASALIASSVTDIGPWYGFKFVLTVFFGSVAMLVVALGVNNLSSRRRYPTYWMGN